MSKWKGTFDCDLNTYDLMKKGQRYLFTDGKTTYEVYFEVVGEGLQEGYEDRDHSYPRWGIPSDPPESVIENVEITDYEFKYCDAYELDENGEIISEDEPFHIVFINEDEGINLNNCGRRAKTLFNSLRRKNKGEYTITESVEDLIYEYCCEADIEDMEYGF